MIQANGLTKHYGETVAVDGATFTVLPGRVTGFLGPNGAGKSTTMRMILGLDRPTAGSVTVNGESYGELPAPLRAVGALIEAKAVDPGRSAYNHLLWLADSNRIERSRVGEALDRVGLSDVAGHRVGTFSLGMNQRLGIAAALLGDPGVLIFDEPINGLDPDGILWIRNLMKSLAREGRTVFLSSHMMSEMAQTAEHLIVIGRGKIIADASVEDIIAGNASTSVRVRATHQDALATLLARRGGVIEELTDGALAVSGLDATAIGAVAAENNIALMELTPEGATLEDAFLELTHNETDYRAATIGAGQGA